MNVSALYDKMEILNVSVRISELFHKYLVFNATWLKVRMLESEYVGSHRKTHEISESFSE
jgi:hypothetical protein